MMGLEYVVEILQKKIEFYICTQTIFVCFRNLKALASKKQ